MYTENILDKELVEPNRVGLLCHETRAPTNDF
jgi:hypothetical protein